LLVGPAVADVLGQRLPPWPGLLGAACAVPAVLAADAVHKLVRSRGADRSTV